MGGDEVRRVSECQHIYRVSVSPPLCRPLFWNRGLRVGDTEGTGKVEESGNTPTIFYYQDKES